MVVMRALDRDILRLAVPALGALAAEPLFLLADTAFALACNSGDDAAVAARCDIRFLRPTHAGDLLVADAREVAGFGRNGIYDVTVTSGEQVVAEFRGASRTLARP